MLMGGGGTESGFCEICDLHAHYTIKVYVQGVGSQ